MGNFQRRLPNPVVTFLPTFEERVMLYRRRDSERNFPGLWAFPGGKVEIGETFVDAVFRELNEETGLSATGEILVLNSYCFGTSTGMTFGVRVASPKLGFGAEIKEPLWVTSVADLERLDRIPGIDNHYHDLRRLLFDRQAWIDASSFNLTSDKYLNT